jgi:putative ABC transport system permease protein
MNNLFQDIRYGLRGLLRQPGFSIVAILSLALGIGANTAIFSVVNGVLLNPLPFRQPEQLMTIHQSKPNFDAGAMPYPNFRDLKERNQTFSAMAISRSFGFSLIGAGETERVTARLITSDFFTVLELKPLLGRTFMPGEDESGAAPVALISEGLWRRKFGAAQDVLQKGVTLDNKSYSVVGVIPSSFNLMQDVDVYVPIGQWGSPALKSRGAALGLHGIGRLKPGVTQAQAEADLNRVMQELAATYPETNRGQGVKLISLRQRVVGDIQPVLWLLLGAVGFVLLIACVNVSNLLLARSTGRAREFAIRAALGAGRRRLVFQSLTESTLLAFVGGALGLLVAAWGTRAALGLLPTALPRADEVRLDGRVLVFTFAISLLTGLLAGLIPALKTSQRRFSETLKEGGRGSSGGRVRAQGVFVAVEMALALVLLIGAGLMIRSLAALWHVDPGFRTDNLTTFVLNLPPSAANASADAVRASLRQLSDKINSAPGVQAASFSSGAFPLLSEDDLFFWIDGQPKPASQSEMSMALIYRVEPAYLKAMNIPLKQGRFFNDQDDERATPVAVIDEAFARQYFGAENPIGRRVQIDGSNNPSQIVGVVGHVKQWSIDAGDADGLQAQLYVPFRGLPDNSLPTGAGVVMRTSGPSGNGSTTLDAIRNVVASQNSLNVISSPQTMDKVIADSLAERRFSMILLGSFSAVALLLASLGIYGVISYLVGQRTHELGIRIALGAQRRDVLQLILNHGMKMTLAGIMLGLVVAVAVTRLLTRMLFGVSPTDPATFAAITLLLLAVALLACIVPAFRATKVDPLVALREE